MAEVEAREPRAGHNMGINPVQISVNDYRMALRREQYTDIQRLRRYDRGVTPSQLSDNQKIQITGQDSAGNPNSDPEVRLNVCTPPIRTEADRLDVQDIAVTVEDDPETSVVLSKLVNKWWKRNRLDEGQQNAYYSGCRDGDSMGIVDYDRKELYPKVFIHQVYAGEEAGADIIYVDGDPNQPVFGFKIWIAKADENTQVRRKNIYYPDRVEKWVSPGSMSDVFADADWRPLTATDDDYTNDLVLTDSLSQPGESATVVWWTVDGTENSEGIGIPVKHFRHDARGLDHGTSTIDLIVPSQQDAVNRAANNLQGGAVLAGFPTNVIIGAEREETTYEVGPAALMVVDEPGGSIGQFAAANLEQLIRVKDTAIKDTATLTSTPLTFYNLSGVIPAEGTLQSLEMGLVAKVETDQVSFGNTWEDIFRLMLKLEKLWGEELVNVPDDVLDNAEINTVWESAKVTNEKEEADIAQQHKAMGVPDRFVFRMLKYTEDEIDAMLTEKGVKRNVVIGALAGRVTEIEAQNEAETVTVEAGNNGTQQPADQPTA